MKKILNLFLLFFAIPFPFFGIPFSNIVFSIYFLFLFFASIIKGKLPPYLLSILIIFSLFLFLSFRSSAFTGLENVLALSRYLIAIIPLFFLLPLTKLFSSLSVNSLRTLLIISQFSFIFTSIYSFVSLCATEYGSPCVLLMNSSSFGAIASVLLLTYSLVCISVKDKFVRFVSILSSIFFFVFGALQGSRLFWALIFVVILLFIYRLTRPVDVINRLKINKRAFISLSLFLFTVIITLNSSFVNNSRSFSRILGFIADPFEDGRFESGQVVGSRLILNFSDILFGRSMFSQLSSWNATSSYDSTLNLMLSDFGLIGTFIIISALIFSISRYWVYICQTHRSLLPLFLGLILYIVGSITNEFLLLKAFNPLCTYLVSFFTVYLGANSPSKQA